MRAKFHIPFLLRGQDRHFGGKIIHFPIHEVWVEIYTNELFDLLMSGHKMNVYKIPMVLFINYEGGSKSNVSSLVTFLLYIVAS